MQALSPAVAGLSVLLEELNETLRRHGAEGFSLMFAPQQIELPEGYVLVQRLNTAAGVIELVPMRIDECETDAVLHETQVIDLGDGEFIRLTAQPGRTHGCTVGGHHPAAGGAPGRVHTHQPR